MRGKGNVLREDLPHVGITPAYAGKSKLQTATGKWIGDHPRLCGEKPDTVHFPECRKGSPPPMRGKVKQMCNFFYIP